MISIRNATADDAVEIGRVHVDSWRTTYAGMIKPETLAGLSYEKSAERNRAFMSSAEAGRHHFVAEDESGHISGFAMGGKSRTEGLGFAGELYGIYLLKECQGRGVGRRLVRAMAEALAADGLKSMLVWVLADNPARRFYEALGGRYVTEQQITIGGQALTEVAYGWDDVAVLLA